jgi:flagellar hook capping protein FlgD
VDLTIHDITGRRVVTLARGVRAAGEHEARWSGTGADGSRSAPGVYFARLSAGGAVASLRVLRIE